MTDKVQKIREEVERMHNLLPVMDGDNISVNYADRICTTLEMYIDSLQEEPVSKPIDFEKELYKAFGQVKDFTLGMRIAKWFYDMGKKSREPVSEDLEEAAYTFVMNNFGNPKESLFLFDQKCFRAGANWQITKLMKDATEVTVHIEAGNYPYIPQLELYDYDKDVPLAKEGYKYKVVLIKDE